MDGQRDDDTVDWCLEEGFKNGHVCVLYRVARNLTFPCGRTPSKDETRFALTCVLLLLLRVAQDVQCCKLDLDKSGLDFVYDAVRGKARTWVGNLNQRRLPPVGDVADGLRRWAAAPRTGLPLPAWPTAFSVRLVNTFVWGSPTDSVVDCCRRNLRLADTRAEVTKAFLAFLGAQTTWDDVLRGDLAAVSTLLP